MGSGLMVCLFIKNRVQQRDPLYSELQISDTIFRPPAVNAQQKLIPHVCIYCDYPLDRYPQAEGEVFSSFE